MDIDSKRLLLEKYLGGFRSWSYESLSAEIARTRREHECLESRQGVFADGTEYQLEFNVFWDDQKNGDLRVCGDLTANSQRKWLGILQAFTPDVTDSFIMRRDGTFIDE